MTDSRCPKCREFLTPPPAGSPPRHGCASCRGAWLPADGLALVAPDRAGFHRLVAEQGTPTGLDCPDCPGATLVQVELAGCALDACPDCHGLFFERGEFETARAARGRVRSGVGEAASTAGLVVGEVIVDAICGLLAATGDLLA